MADKAVCTVLVVLALLAVVAVARAAGGRGHGTGHGKGLQGGAPRQPCGPGRMCPYPYVCTGSGVCEIMDSCASDQCTSKKGAKCINGRCANSGTSCARWNVYSPSQKVLPRGILGRASPTSPLVPVGAQGADGRWHLGATAASPADPDWGLFVASDGAAAWRPSQMYYLEYDDNLTGYCDTSRLRIAGEVGAPLTFNGVGVCWDASGVPGAFAPADKLGRCTQWGMGTYLPLGNQALCEVNPGPNCA